MSNQNLPLVSVIMPVFNGERYVRAAVESILGQSFTDYELIIINDGSTDGSDEILQKYASIEGRVVYGVHEQNRGLVAVLNEGLEIAKGEFIARMDADDISLPERLERQVEFLKQTPHVGVVGTQMNILDASGVKTGQFQVPLEHNRIIWSLMFGRSFAHPSIMLRKSLFEKTGGYNSDFHVTEDQELWMRLAWLTQFANLPQILVNYRSHSLSVSRQKADLQKRQILTLRRQLSSQILGREIPVETLEFLRQSQIHTGGVSQQNLKTVVIPFLLELFEGFKQKNLFIGEIDGVNADFVDKIVRASQSVEDRIDLRENARLIPTSVSFWKKIANRLKQRRHVPLPGTRQDHGQTAESIVSPTVRGSNGQNDGISVIVLSFERLTSLQLMLESLYAQDLGGVNIELIVCNNSSRVHLKQTPFTALGRTLSKFSEIKILNVNYSWRTAIRYALATLAKYNTVLFLDDDVVLQDRKFVSYMFSSFQKLRPPDILSCWNRLWSEWNEDTYSSISLNFKTPAVTSLTKCDVAGPGICMFHKMILSPRVLDVVMNPEFPRAYDLAFSLIVSMEHGGDCYYLPSFGMLDFHDERRQEPLMPSPKKNATAYDDLNALFKSMLKQGYQPVVSRLSMNDTDSSPEQQALKLLPSHTLPW